MVILWDCCEESFRHLYFLGVCVCDVCPPGLSLSPRCWLSEQLSKRTGRAKERLPCLCWFIKRCNTRHLRSPRPLFFLHYLTSCVTSFVQNSAPLLIFIYLFISTFVTFWESFITVHSGIVFCLWYLEMSKLSFH